MYGIVQDTRLFQHRTHRLACHAIVDTPAFVLRPRVEAVAPPGVLPAVGVQQAEGIDEALVQEAGHPLPLFGQEAAVGGIAHRVVNVYRLVADVIVPAQHQLGTGAQQFHRIVPEVFQPLHLKGLALVPEG